jgi:hypothetical protein
MVQRLALNTKRLSFSLADDDCDAISLSMDCLTLWQMQSLNRASNKRAKKNRWIKRCCIKLQSHRYNTINRLPCTRVHSFPRRVLQFPNSRLDCRSTFSLSERRECCLGFLLVYSTVQRVHCQCASPTTILYLFVAAKRDARCPFFNNAWCLTEATHSQ